MFLQERYSHYSLTDPFLALQRDFECGVPRGDKERRPLGTSPISVLEAVMAHCRKMQERMSAQLAAAESRQKRVRDEDGSWSVLRVLNAAYARYLCVADNGICPPNKAVISWFLLMLVAACTQRSWIRAVTKVPQ